jgi:hypothetical protein
MSGYYDEMTGRHYCDCGAPTVYQMFSGGEEFYCESCGNQARYPEGEGGPRARLLAEPDGAPKLRRMMYDEIARRKKLV